MLEAERTKAALIDTSENWVGIIIGQEAILKVLNSKMRKTFGRNVHMRRLRLGEKFSVIRLFNRVFSEKPVRLYSLKCAWTQAGSWWTRLIKEFIKRGINTLYVDLEVYIELSRKVHPAYLKLLNVYPSKEDAQCAGILAYGDSHRKFVRNIWKELAIERGSSQVG